MRRHLCVADGGRVVRQLRAAHSDESLMRGGGSGRFRNDTERMMEGGARLPDIRQIHPQGCGSIHDLAELCGGTMRGGELQVLHASVIDVPHCFKLEKKVFACGTPQARARWVEGIRRAMNPRRDADRRVEHSLSVWILEAKGVAVKRRYYCELCLDGCLYARTSAKPRQDICFWGESYEFSCIPPVNDICINLFREADPKKKKDRSTLIGFVRIAIGQIAQRYPVEKWYTVSTSADGRQADGVSAGSSSAKSNGNGGDAPAIRVKARFQTVDILPRHCYDRLLVFVRDNYLPLCLVLEPVLGVKAKEDLAISLVRVLHRERLAKQFLCDLIMAEINALDNDHLMFRGNSLATKAMEAYMKLVAADYLQATLGEFVRGVLDSPENCEVDPLKLGNGSPSAAELQRNRRTLTALVERAWRRILDAAPALPTQLREVFRELRTRIERTGRSGSGDVANTLISSSIFLRFLCPAILSPSLFNLVHEYPSGMAARNLTLIAKTLQTLANFTRFGGKESYMEFMNAFVECEFRRMHDFLVRISQPPVAADGNTQAADGMMVFCSGHPTNGAAIAPCRLATDADVDAEIDFGKEAALLYAYLQESWTAQIQEKAKLENKRLAELWAILLEVAMKRTESADLASGSAVAAANASSASASSNNGSSSHHHPSTSSSNGSRHSSSQGGNNGGGGARIHPDYDNPPQYDADDDFNDLGSNCGGDDGNGRSGNGTTTSGNPPSDYENNVISHHISTSNQRPSANTGCFPQASSSSAANADHRYYCQPHVVADRLDTADDYVLSEALPYSNNGNGPPHVASSSCYYYSSNERSPVAINPSVRHNEFYVAEQHNPLVTAVKSSSGSGSLMNGQFLNLSLSSGGCRRSSSPKQSYDQFSNLNSVVPTQKSNGFFVQQAGRVGIHHSHHRLPPNGQHGQHQHQPRIPSGGKAEDYCYPSDVVPVAEGSYYDCTPKASCSTTSSSVAPPSHHRSGSSSSTRREYYHIYDDTPSLPSSSCYDGHHRPSPLQRSASSGRKTNRQSPPLSPSYHIADQAPNFYDEVPSLSTAYNRFMPPSVANVKPAAGRTNTMGRRNAADEAEDAEEDEELKMALQNAHRFATAHSIPSVIPPPPAPRQQLQQRPKMTAPTTVSCCNSLPPPLSATVTPMSSSSSSAGYHSGGPATAAHSINYNSYSFPSDHHNRHQLIPTRSPESNEQCTNGFCHQTDDDAAAATIAAADGTASSQGYASAAPTIDECGCGSSSASASSAASYHRLSSAPPSANGTLSSSASSSSGVPPRPTQASAVITASPIPARAVLVGASVGTFYFDGIPDDDASAIPSALNGCDALPKNGVNLSTVIGGSYCAAAKKCSAASTKSASDAEDIIDRQKREIEKLLRENDQLKRELADRDGSGTSMSVSNGSASIVAPSVAGRRLADSSSLGHFERK